MRGEPFGLGELDLAGEGVQVANEGLQDLASRLAAPGEGIARGLASARPSARVRSSEPAVDRQLATQRRGRDARVVASAIGRDAHHDRNPVEPQVRAVAEVEHCALARRQAVHGGPDRQPPLASTSSDSVVMAVIRSTTARARRPRRWWSMASR